MTSAQLLYQEDMLEALQAMRGTLGDVKNPHAVALGRLGGLKGGPKGGRARAESLSARRRTEIARRAAAARWGHLPEALRTLFPGDRFEKLSLPGDLDLVMLHVLSQGGDGHKRWLVRRFGDIGVRRWIVAHKGRGLTVAQMTPWVSVRTARSWLAREPGESPTVADVRTWLGEAGVPLSGSAVATHRGPDRLEDLAVEAVRVAPLDATLTRALPLFFWRNRSRLDPGTLVNLARRHKEARTMGFFLDLTGELSGDQSFSAAAEQLRSKRRPAETYFFRSSSESPFAREAARINAPLVARRWGFFMNMPLDSFQTLFEKFSHRHATSRAS